MALDSRELIENDANVADERPVWRSPVLTVAPAGNAETGVSGNIDGPGTS
jgi:hypothetical protein